MMKKFPCIVAALGLGMVGAGSAFAYRGGHVGVFIGVPVAPWYYPPPYYYPPGYGAPPVIIQQQAPVYIEQPAPASEPAPAQNNDWYYCGSARRYYPYVKECPEGWQRVSPQPPPAQ